MSPTKRHFIVILTRRCALPARAERADFEEEGGVRSEVEGQAWHHLVREDELGIRLEAQGYPRRAPARTPGNVL